MDLTVRSKKRRTGSILSETSDEILRVNGGGVGADYVNGGGGGADSDNSEENTVR